MERFIFCQQLRSSGTMNAAVHTAATQQRLVGSVDDSIHLHFCDVISDDLKRHNQAIPFGYFAPVSSLSSGIRSGYFPSVRMSYKYLLSRIISSRISCQSGIGVRAIRMTARIAPTNAAAPMTANNFLLSFFFAALPISAAQAMQTAAAKSAMPSVSHSQDSSYRIFMRSSSPVR